MRITRPMCSSVLLLILAAVVAFGQLNTGSISGTVKDPSGAAIPNAKVTLTDNGKGFTYSSVTDNSGLFTIRSLPASTYTETVDVSGFAKYRRPDIVLNVGTAVNADVNLEVASGTQTVTVNESGAPLLQTEDASTGQTINRTFINDLPLIGRQVFDLAFLAPGVAQAPGKVYGAGASSGNNFVSDGGRNAQADILIDGITTTNYEQNGGFVVPLYTPSVDAVQEFRLMQTNFSAEYGFTGGTIINVVTRSGTNQVHGSLYEFFRNDKLNANDFFSNKNGSARPEYRWNDYGATIGGPIKKDRVFFFGDWEGNRTVTPQTQTLGVPDAAERTGDFGELCGRYGGAFDSSGICRYTSGANTGKIDTSGQLFDPYANLVKVNGGRFMTTPIPYDNLATYASPANGSPAGLNFNYSKAQYVAGDNNTYTGTGTALPGYMGITPGKAGNLLDPVALNILKYIPLPNIAGGAPNANWFGSGTQPNRSDQFDIKIDSRLTDMDQFSFKVSDRLTKGLSGADLFGNPFSNTSQGYNTSTSVTTGVNYTHTFNATTLLTASAGYTHSWSHTHGLPEQYSDFSSITSLGLPSYIQSAGINAAPEIQLGQYGTVGGQAWSVLLQGSDVYQMIASVSKTAGNHDLHFGGEFRSHRINFTQYGLPGGIFNFGQGGTGADELASFMTGFPTGWSAYQIPNAPAAQNLQEGMFIQDNWHVNDRLTLNLGLRYDIDMPRTERYNRMTYFDPSAPSPLQAYSSVCAQCADLTGALLYTGYNGNPRSPYDTYYGAIGPRIGLAYRLGQKTTIRSGYGIYYDPAKSGAAGAGSGQGGFMSWIVQPTMTTVNSSDNVTPVARLSVPFPGSPGASIAQPPGFSTPQALLAMPGGDSGSAPVNTWNVLPQEQSWSFGIERELPWSILLDAEYVGRAGHHLYLGGDTYALNHIPASVQQQYVTGNYGGSSSRVSQLNGYVNSPVSNAGQLLTLAQGQGAYSNSFFQGYAGTPGTGGQVFLYDTYLPYPQYPTGVWGDSGLQNIDPPWANSIYNAFQLRLEKRFSSGIQFLVTYAHSKSLDDASTAGSNMYLSSGVNNNNTVPATIQDPNNLRLERSYSNFDIPDVFQASWVYQLPFGKGKRLGSNWNGVVNGVLGGWQLNGNYRWDNGTPLILGLNGGTSAPNYNQRANYPTALQISSNYANTQQYFSNASGPATPVVFNSPDPTTGMQCSSDPWVPCKYADGTAPRTLNVRAPGSNNWSASLFKNFRLWSESSKLEIGIEAFNLFNQVQFAAPALTVGNSNFGQITAQANQPREFQLRAKLYF